MANKERTLYIKDIFNDRDLEVTIRDEDMISTLKSKVEAKLELKLLRLMVKKGNRNNPILVEVTKKVKDYHLHNGDTILVGKDDVVGGYSIN